MHIDPYLHAHAVIRDRLRHLQRCADVHDGSGSQASADAVEALRGAVEGHLGHEDRHLYPLLALSPDASAVALGRRYSEEMLDIGTVWVRHQRRWASAAAIAAEPVLFAADTASLARLLEERMQREERELYPAAARQDDSPR